MSTRPDATILAYDPFGEPAEVVRGYAMTPGDRRARNAAVAVFWSLALLLTAGRVYLGDQPVAQQVASVQAQVASLITAVR
ncbi:hypothetical protein [Methylobacterium nigriterrae]|uniref:hypothetical protein n=1 Tax=Methylobacterium nigriterrae TaxID=3127512 RepID=UPI003013E4C5